MAYPTDPLSTQFVNGTTETGASLEAKITTPLNGIRKAASLGMIADTTSGASVTLATAGTGYASPASLTYTAPYSMTVRVDLTVLFSMASGGSNSACTAQVAYNTGTSANAGSASTVGLRGATVCTTANPQSAEAYGFVTLTGGTTYTFYALVMRRANGTTTDTCSSSQVSLTDMGGR